MDGAASDPILRAQAEAHAEAFKAEPKEKPRRRKRPRFPSPANKVEQFTRRRRTEIAMRRLAEHISPEQVIFDFVHWGIDPAEAKRIVDDAVDQNQAEQFRERVQPIWVGGSMLLVGILLTMIGADRSSFTDGRIHRYLILGVTILPAAAAYAIFGLIQLFAARSEAHHTDQTSEIKPPPEMPAETSAHVTARPDAEAMTRHDDASMTISGNLELQRAAA